MGLGWDPIRVDLRELGQRLGPWLRGRSPHARDGAAATPPRRRVTSPRISTGSSCDSLSSSNASL